MRGIPLGTASLLSAPIVVHPAAWHLRGPVYACLSGLGKLQACVWDSGFRLDRQCRISEGPGVGDGRVLC